MDLFGGDRMNDKAQTGAPAAASARIERALEEAIAARNEGRPELAIERMTQAMGWLDAGSVRRELRVAIPRELGFAHLVAGDAKASREALLLALEQAAHDPVLSDPVRAGLATCELMCGAPTRARQMLEGRGRNRRATLSALARIHLYEGQTQAAEAALQEADQAPGGTTASGVLLPPATVLRCLAAVWGGRPDQARMLYDGVSTRDSALWELVRVALLRAVWAQSGDGRYLALASSTAEQLRFSEPPAGLPGFVPAVTAQHAAIYSLAGEIAMSIEAADLALAALEEPQALVLPEWPRAAMVADLLLVYRNAGDEQRWSKAFAHWDGLTWGSWAERMPLVSGPRVSAALKTDVEEPIEDTGPSTFESLAIRLLEDPKNARLMALRAIGAHAMALGVEWTAADGLSLGRIGARPPHDGDRETTPDGVVRLPLGNGESLWLFKAQPEAVRGLDREALDGLARIVSVRENEAKNTATLLDRLTTAEAAQRLAEDRLEQVRRPGTDRGHGGRFPTVIGRSDRLRQVLDRLGALARVEAHVLIEGLPGSGRRHLAQALFLCESDDPTGSTRAPSLECGLLPEDATLQIEALERLEKLAQRGAGLAILAEPTALLAEASSWLLERLSAPRPQGIRWVVTLDSRDQSPAAVALRARVPSQVRVPGLDERLEDLPLLCDHFAREVGKRPDDLSTATRALLARKAYPGQVAELRSAIRGAAGRAGHGLVQPEHFERPQQASGGADQAFEDPLALGLREATRQLQRQLVQRALEATTGHLGRAADLLGVPKPQLEKLAQSLGVDLRDAP